MMRSVWLSTLAILLAAFTFTACVSDDPNEIVEDYSRDDTREPPEPTTPSYGQPDSPTTPDTPDPGTNPDPGDDPGDDTGSSGFPDSIGGGDSTGGDDTGGDDTGGDDTGGDDTGGDDTGTDTPDGSVAAGGLCNCDSDCAAVDGQAGICVYGVCMIRASADCSAGGSTDECPAGSRCWFLGDWPGPICWPDCDSFTCEGTCDADGSCSPGETTDCDLSCGSYCSSATGGDDTGGDDTGGDDTGGGTVVSGVIGAACTTDDQCDGALCQPDDDNGWIDGYCFGWDCATPGATCGTGGVCVAELGSSGENVCMQACDGGCRDGYECMSYGEQTFCYPYCEMTADCPAGYACQDNACIPGEPCSASAPEGYCSEGEICIDGSCEQECSSSNPSGFCPDGFHCDAGYCTSDSGCGTWQCTGSDCTDLVQMPGSFDPNSAQARADGYYIATHPNYSFLRRDLTVLIQWAACEMRAAFPGVAPIGLADMTQADGLTPGVDVGQPRHMESTHRGDDIDIGYFQTDGTNNPQIICGDGSDDNPNGYSGTYNDGYFCTTEQNIVQFEHQTWFLALMASHDDWRVVGVDETLEDDINAETERLFSEGLINSTTRSRLYSLGTGAEGYWQFHHHHLHFSYY